MSPTITAAEPKPKKAPYADEEIDLFAQRIAEILGKRPARFCVNVDLFCARIEKLLVQSERRRLL